MRRLALALGGLALASCGGELTLDPRRVADARRGAPLAPDARGRGAGAARGAAPDPHPPDGGASFEPPDPDMCEVTHVRAREWLAAAFAELGYDVERERGHDGAFAVENVIATLPGASPEVVLVGAHYDALYAAADDNSTGVAVVLEVARVLRGRRYERTVRFVGFDLEELGMVGATLYARAHAGEIVALFNIDGVGFTAPDQPSVPGIPLPSRGDFVLVIGNEPSTDLTAETRGVARALDIGRVEALVAAGDGTSALLGLVRIAGSDKAPFWARGVSAVMLTDTGPVRQDSYHSAADDVAGLDATFLAANARVTAAAVAYQARVIP